METLIEIVGAILMLVCVCVLIKFTVAKNIKEFHIHFSISEGFDIKASFFNESPTKDQL